MVNGDRNKALPQSPDAARYSADRFLTVALQPGGALLTPSPQTPEFLARNTLLQPAVFKPPKTVRSPPHSDTGRFPGHQQQDSGATVFEDVDSSDSGDNAVGIQHFGSIKHRPLPLRQQEHDNQKPQQGSPLRQRRLAPPNLGITVPNERLISELSPNLRRTPRAGDERRRNGVVIPDNYTPVPDHIASSSSTPELSRVSPATLATPRKFVKKLSLPPAPGWWEEDREGTRETVLLPPGTHATHFCIDSIWHLMFVG